MKQKIIIGLLLIAVSLGVGILIAGFSNNQNNVPALKTTAVNPSAEQEASSPTYHLAGAVSPFEGDPISGIEVYYTCFSGGKWSEVASTKTNSTGNYMITGLSAKADCAVGVGKFNLVEGDFKKNISNAYFDSPRLITVKGNVDNNNFSHIGKTQSVFKGTIGGPAQKDRVQVTIKCEDDEGGNEIYARTISEYNTGEFYLPVNNPGYVKSCTMTAEREGYSFEPASIKVDFEKFAGYQFKSNGAAADDKLNIYGVVKYNNDKGDVIKGVTVKADCKKAGKATEIKDETNALGQYNLAKVPQGADCTVTASSASEDLTFTNLPKKFTDFQKGAIFDIYAKKGAADDKAVKLSGKATYENNGKVIEGVKVQITDCVSPNEQVEKNATTDAKGEYIITGIPKGITCTVKVSKSGLTFKSNDFKLKFSQDEEFNPKATAGVSDDGSCRDLGKAIADDKNEDDLDAADVLEAETQYRKQGKKLVNKKGKEVDPNCDGKFTYADVVALVQCKVKSYDVSCSQ